MAGRLARADAFLTRHPLVDTGVAVGGGTAIGLGVRHHQRRVKSRTNRGAANIGKRLVDEETRTSVVHGIGVGAGMGAIAWGGSRSKMLSRGLRANAASMEHSPGVRRTLAAAERARASMERATEPLGRAAGVGFGRMPPPVRHALQTVPLPLRPATAGLAGAILVQHARPIRRKTYSPVVETGGY